MSESCDEVTFVPAPVLIVRRLTDGQEMVRLPATSHVLARRIARQWRAEVKVISGGPGVPIRRGSGMGGTPPWAS
jgi:hypothetical protein